MALPLAPIALTALRVAAVAATAYALTRATREAPKHVWREKALDDTPEGLGITTQRAEAEANTHAAARLSRTFRLGSGPGIEIDVAALCRLRFRRVD